MLVNSQAKQLYPVGIGSSRAVAGGTGDNTAVVNAAGIDTKNYNSALIIVSGSTTLANTESLALTVATTECATLGGSYTAKETVANAVTLVTSTGDTHTGAVAYAIDLDDYKRFVKVSFTPNLSASGTDTSTLSCTLVLCNKTEQPVTLPTTFA